ncbi:hypothetical protein ACFX16_013190 [Malus domestica]
MRMKLSLYGAWRNNESSDGEIRRRADQCRREEATGRTTMAIRDDGENDDGERDDGEKDDGVRRYRGERSEKARNGNQTKALFGMSMEENADNIDEISPILSVFRAMDI